MFKFLCRNPNYLLNGSVQKSLVYLFIGLSISVERDFSIVAILLGNSRYNIMNTGGDFQATFDQQQQQSQQFNDTGVATVSSSSSCSTSSSNSSNGRRASDVSVGSSSSDSGNSSNNVSPANNTTNTNNDQQQGQQQGNGQTTPLVVVHPVANYPTTSVQQQQQLMQPQSSSNSNFLPNFPIPQTFSSHFPIPIGGGNCGGSGGGAFTRFDSSAPTSTNNKIKVTLANADLWRKFNRFTNEMVVTRPGRFHPYSLSLI